MITADDREVMVSLPPDAKPLFAWDLLGVDPSAELRSGRASEIAATEARGYRKAIERLRDHERYFQWARDTDDLRCEPTPVALTWVADYLEAMEASDV